VGAFYRAHGCGGVSIPHQYGRLKEWAFKEYSSVPIPYESDGHWAGIDLGRVMHVKRGAISGAQLDGVLTVPSSVTELDEGAFEGAFYMSDLVFEEGALSETSGVVPADAFADFGAAKAWDCGCDFDPATFLFGADIDEPYYDFLELSGFDATIAPYVSNIPDSLLLDPLVGDAATCNPTCAKTFFGIDAPSQRDTVVGRLDLSPLSRVSPACTLGARAFARSMFSGALTVSCEYSEETFADMHFIDSITIDHPATAAPVTVPRMAFFHSFSAKSVTFGDALTRGMREDGLSVGAAAFALMYSLEHINLPPFAADAAPRTDFDDLAFFGDFQLSSTIGTADPASLGLAKTIGTYLNGEAAFGDPTDTSLELALPPRSTCIFNVDSPDDFGRLAFGATYSLAECCHTSSPADALEFGNIHEAVPHSPADGADYNGGWYHFNSWGDNPFAFCGGASQFWKSVEVPGAPYASPSQEELNDKTNWAATPWGHPDWHKTGPMCVYADPFDGNDEQVFMRMPACENMVSRLYYDHRFNNREPLEER